MSSCLSIYQFFLLKKDHVVRFATDFSINGDIKNNYSLSYYGQSNCSRNAYIFCGVEFCTGKVN